MSNITREYVLELAKLYGIEVNKDSKQHLVEDENGHITELKKQDIPELFGVDFDSDIKWYHIEDNEFQHNNHNDEELSYKQELELVINSAKVLQRSYEICEEIGIKEEYTFDEQDRFEALTSRFARTSDILIQKTFRLIDIIELENIGSIIDRLQRAEKRGLIASAEEFKQIRRLRINIAHQYTQLELTKMFYEVLNLCPILLDGVERVKKYHVPEI